MPEYMLAIMTLNHRSMFLSDCYWNTPLKCRPIVKKSIEIETKRLQQRRLKLVDKLSTLIAKS